MWRKVALIILRNRVYLLAVVALITAFFAYFLVTQIEIDNRYGIILPDDHPIQHDYKKFKRQFGEDGSTMVVVVSSKQLYTPSNFKKLKILGDKILALPGVLHVISEANLFYLTKDTSRFKKQFISHRIFFDTTYSEKSIETIRHLVRGNPLYDKLLYNRKANISLMLIGLDESFIKDKKNARVVAKIETLARGYEKSLGPMRFTGLPHFRFAMTERIWREMYLFLTLSFLITTALIYYFYRSIRILFICLTIVGISIVWALGMAALLGYPITPMMAVVPPLLVIIGVPNIIYIITHFYQEFLKSGNKIKCIYTTLRHIGPITFLMNLTTAIGFITFTNSERLREFGIISSVNVMVVFSLSLLLVGILLSYFGPPKEKHMSFLTQKTSLHFIHKLSHIIQHRKKTVYAITTALFLIAVWGTSFIEVTGNVTGDILKNDPIAKDFAYMEKNFGGTIPFEILVNYSPRAGIFNKPLMDQVQEAQNLIDGDSLFSKSLSYINLLKFLNMSLHENDSSFYKIPTKRELILLKEYMDNFNFNGINNSRISIKDLVDTSSKTLRIRAQMRDLGSLIVTDKISALRLKINRIFNPHQEELEAFVLAYASGKETYFDSLMENSAIANAFILELSIKDPAVLQDLEVNPENIYLYRNSKNSLPILKRVVEQQRLVINFTGISVVVSEGTKYLVRNLWQTLVFTILLISLIIYFLFKSFYVNLATMLPNIIPLVITAGIMGIFNIPLKPSTLIIFGIAIGITINDAILLLAKLKTGIKRFPHLSKSELLIKALEDNALGMAYTSIVLFFGFILFTFSQFGGTQALGFLISITILNGMFTNLILLPCLLLSFENRWKKQDIQNAEIEGL